jgi:hypothetical protein
VAGRPVLHWGRSQHGEKRLLAWSCVSVSMEQHGCTGRISITFYILGFSENLSRKFKSNLKSEMSNGYFTRIFIYIYDSISAFFLKWDPLRHKVLNTLFPKIVPFLYNVKKTQNTLLLLHYNNGYENAPQRYVLRTFFILLFYLTTFISYLYYVPMVADFVIFFNW